MRKLHLLLLILSVAILSACTMTSRMERRQFNSRLTHMSREMVKKQQEEAYNSIKERLEYDTLGPAGVKQSAFDPANFKEDSEGKLVASVEARKVSVVSRTRVLAERDGKIAIDFIITMPSELQGTSQSIVVTPQLHRVDSVERLEPLQIRGGLFQLLQQRNYWRYQKYRTHLINKCGGQLAAADTVKLKRIFEQYIDFPYLDRARLDSIMSKKETVAFFYTQTVPVKEGEKSIGVTLDGKVVALDGSRYEMPPKDTISFNISTMLFFVENITRYKTQIIEKFAVVNDRNFLSFGVGKSNIVDTLGDNKQQLEKIGDMMTKMLRQHDFYIDNITLSAAASPEGSERMNMLLSDKRAQSLKEYLQTKNRDLPELDTMFKIKTVGENWIELKRLIAEDYTIQNRVEINETIDRMNKAGSMDACETQICATYPEDYNYIKKVIYPQLRTVDFRYNLRRIGMIKDTIHTSTIDTAYMDAVELLKARQYSKAAEVLLDYNDINSAVVMLSLGYNNSAYDLLFRLPEDDEKVLYLRAIICSRLGKFKEGLENYRKVVEINDSWEYRGRLDPEISALLINEEASKISGQ